MFCGVRAFGCDATSVRFVFKESPRCSRGSRIADKLLASLVWAAEGWGFSEGREFKSPCLTRDRRRW